MPEDSFIDIVKDIRDTKHPDIVEKHNEVLANTISSAAIRADIITMKAATVSAAGNAEVFLGQMRVIADENISYFEASARAADNALSSATTAVGAVGVVTSQLAIMQSMSAAAAAVQLSNLRNNTISAAASAATSAAAAITKADEASTARNAAILAVGQAQTIKDSIWAVNVPIKWVQYASYEDTTLTICPINHKTYMANKDIEDSVTEPSLDSANWDLYTIASVNVNGNAITVSIRSNTAANLANTVLALGEMAQEIDQNGFVKIGDGVTVYSALPYIGEGRFSEFVKTILADADASAVLSTLGVSTFVKTILAAADASAVLSTLGAAADSATVHKTGAETIAGVKTFSSSPLIPTPLASKNDTTAVTAEWVNAKQTGFKNKIINGSFNVAQLSSTYALSSSPGYGSVDNFCFLQSASANGIANQVNSGLTGFKKCLKFGRNSGATQTGALICWQALETVDSIPLAGKAATLSFYAKAGANFSATSSQIQVAINSSTGTDQAASNMFSWAGFAQPVASDITLTTSWQRFTITGNIPSGATQLGLSLVFTPTGTAGADDNIYITGIQLEEGSVATPVESRLFMQELALCQRHLEPINIAFDGYATNGANYSAIAPFKVTKRTVPTITVSNVSTVGMSTTPLLSYVTLDMASIYHQATVTGVCNFRDICWASARL